MDPKLSATGSPLLNSPGETIRSELAARNLDVFNLARALDVDLETAENLLEGEEVLTHQFASKLAHFFGISGEVWMRLEAQYRAALALRADLAEVPIRLSGTVSLSIPRSLQRRALDLAAVEKVSLNHLLLALIAEGITRHELESKADPPN